MFKFTNKGAIYCLLSILVLVVIEQLTGRDVGIGVLGALVFLFYGGFFDDVKHDNRINDGGDKSIPPTTSE